MFLLLCHSYEEKAWFNDTLSVKKQQMVLFKTSDENVLSAMHTVSIFSHPCHKNCFYNFLHLFSFWRFEKQRLLSPSSQRAAMG